MARGSGRITRTGVSVGKGYVERDGGGYRSETLALEKGIGRGIPMERERSKGGGGGWWRVAGVGGRGEGQGRKIPATSRLICSSAHLYVSRVRAYIFFLPSPVRLHIHMSRMYMRAPARTRVLFVIPMCFIRRSCAFARTTIRRDEVTDDGGGGEEGTRK